uniref:Si:ch211-216l23.2 n=2 Tax=Astyanax mexicanus TaxID=7994 RepID=A0A8B9RDB2_ASTMX
MSSWAQGSGGRRPQTSPSGGGLQPLRSYRRQPYPTREERLDAHHESVSYENVEQQDDYSGTANYETYEHSAHQPHQTHKPKVPSSSGDGEHTALYQRLYDQFHGDGAKKPADCVVLSVKTQNMDYPKSLGHCLQERGLSVEMLYLQTESGLTRALQDVRSDGSPLCILVEQTNVTLSSCTVIIFSESLKIHRNMPKDQALEFVMVEFRRLGGGRRQHESADAAARTTELTDDYLERAKLEHHFMPSTTRHLLFLMAEGLHLYSEELATIAEYVQNHQKRLQALANESENKVTPETLTSLPAGLGNPPPLLPTPISQSQPQSEHSAMPSGMGEPAHDSYLKTKPPPLLSMDVLQGSPHRPSASHGHGAPHSSGTTHGPPSSFTPQLSRGPLGPRGPPLPRGPPGLRSLLGQRESPAPHGPHPHQGLPGPHGPPATHGSSDHEPHDFHSPRGPLLGHGPPPSHGPPLLRGPPSQNGPSGPRGPPPQRGPRAPPPALRSLHMGNQTGPAPRPLRRLLP